MSMAAGSSMRDEVARGTCPSSGSPSVPTSKRHGQHGLGGLIHGTALQLPADEIVERLIRAAEFEIGADFDRVDALQQRIEELRQA